MTLFAVSLRARRRPLHALALVALVLASTPAFARPMPFLADVAVGSATTPEAVVAGDIDGDGDLDLAAAARAADEVVWFEDTGSGFTRRVVTDTLDGPVDLALGDIDCDGDLDVVIAASASDTVVWYRNRGRTNAWTLGATLSTTASAVSSVAVGDINGDGDLDVVGALPGSDQIMRWRNQGCPGTSWTSAAVANLTTPPVEVALGDVDRDGLLDVVAALRDADAVAWYRNTGAGQWAQTTIDDGVPGAGDVAVGDVDSDGRLDVAAAANDGNELSWWSNPGTGPTWSATTIGAVLSPIDAQLGDVDRDGDLDLLSVSGSASEPLRWWESASGGGAWTPHTIDAAPGTPRAVVAFDRGPDGDVDVATASFVHGGVRLYANASTHRSGLLGDLGATLHVNSLREVADWEAGDVDGDGRPDLVAIDRDLGNPDAIVHWMRNTGVDSNGVLSFAPQQQISVEALYAYEDLALGDLDGDGDLDVLIGEAMSSAFGGTLCLNGGGAASWSCGTPITGYRGLFGVELGDIDGDGDLDAVAAAQQSVGAGRGVVWWETGGSGAWPDNVVETVVGGLHRVLPRDLDGDGDLDLLTNTESWWRHDGASPPGWVEEALPVAPLTQVFTTEAGDVDRDGDLDVVAELGTPAGTALVWFENQLDTTAATWVERPLRAAAGDVDFHDLALADLDLDGDLDVVAGRSLINAGTSVVWYMNHVEVPSAPWHERVATPPLGAEVSGFRVLAADFDGDGDPDVVGGRDEVDCASWLNGGGQFALSTSPAAPPGIGEASETAVLRIDALHRGRGGETAMELAALRLRVESPAGTPLTVEEVEEVVDEVRLYRDDGSGSFEPLLDSRVPAFFGLSLPADVTLVPHDGSAPAQHAPEQTPATYFVTVLLQPNASLAGFSSLTIRHLQEGSAAEDAAFDMPLLREALGDVWETFDVLDTVSDSFVFADDFETGSLGEWSGATGPP